MADVGSLRETVRLLGGRASLWRFHRERLAEAGVDEAALDAVEEAVQRAVGAAAAETVKLHVVVGPAGALRIDASSEPSSLAVPGGPVLVPVPVTRLPVLPPHAAKPADRAYWDGPQRLAHLRGGDQAVLVDPRGLVIDGGTATVWALLGDVLVTPPAPPAVAGVARRFILSEVAPAASVAIEVRPLTLAELEGADEVALSNAVGGLVAARGRGGPVMARLGEAYDSALERLR